MPLVIADRVREQSTTTGTGTLTLTGAVIGYQTFSAAVGNGNTTYYTISNPGTTEWEVGIGTVSAGQLARSTILESSNSDALVNFTAGTKDVFVTYPAEKAVYLDANGNVSALGNVNSGTWQGTVITVPYGGTGAASFTTGALVKGNGTAALSEASAADIVAAIGSTAVQNATNATNVSGGTISNATIDDTNTVELKDTLFTLEDEVDATKKARFQLSGIATATTVTYTLPAGSAGASTLMDLATAQTINGTKTFSAATQNLGSNTGASTINVGYGATTSGTTKTVNIGTAGVSGSITNINIGSAVSGSTGTTNINSPTLTHQGAVVLDANNFATYADPAGTAVAMAIALG